MDKIFRVTVALTFCGALLNTRGLDARTINDDRNVLQYEVAEASDLILEESLQNDKRLWLMTDEEFLSMAPDQNIFVAFGSLHCSQTIKYMTSMREAFKSPPVPNFNYAFIDCDVATEICSNENITRTPTLKLYTGGFKIDYGGDVDRTSIEEFLFEAYSEPSKNFSWDLRERAGGFCTRKCRQKDVIMTAVCVAGSSADRGDTAEVNVDLNSGDNGQWFSWPRHQDECIPAGATKGEYIWQLNKFFCHIREGEPAHDASSAGICTRPNGYQLSNLDPLTMRLMIHELDGGDSSDDIWSSFIHAPQWHDDTCEDYEISVYTTFEDKRNSDTCLKGSLSGKGAEVSMSKCIEKTLPAERFTVNLKVSPAKTDGNCLYLHKDYDGYDLHEPLRNINSANDCLRKCHENVLCTRFTWHFNNVCLLKYGSQEIGPKRDCDFCIAGKRDCGSSNSCFYHKKDYYGNDLKEVNNIVSAARCRQVCQAETGCTRFTWHSHTNVCLIKHGNAEAAPETDCDFCISGPRDC